MAAITLEDVTKVYPNGFEAVHKLSLDVADGEFMVLVGPSGCGKTTALRMVAGLEDITDGTLHIGDRVMNEVSPRDRDIAMVFQNYALYPHMTVAENIGFALKLRKLPKTEIKRKVEEAASLLGLTESLDRKPGQLSGGQRQRVAMGRAIVREPSAFLMDEPLSNLDAKLRVQMRAEVARIQRRLAVATLYVTHDQVEAMTMGDRVAVISAGVLQQCDVPQALYDHPTNLFVASFLGSPGMNLFEGSVGEDAGYVLIGTQRVELPETLHESKPALRRYANERVVVGLRPEDLILPGGEQDQASTGWAPFECEVELVEALGSELLVHFTSDARAVQVAEVENDDSQGLDQGTLTKGGEGVARADARARITGGARVRFYIDPQRLHFFDIETKAAISA
ncbi:MAG: ABC transporter ATP-binding protein [Acidimicrobiales bacterium]